MGDINLSNNDIEIKNNYLFNNNDAKLLINNIEEDKLCLICLELDGIIILCSKCKYKYCQDCAIKLNNNCSICLRNNKKNLMYDNDLSDYSYIYHHYEEPRIPIRFSIFHLFINLFMGLIWIIIFLFFGYVGILFIVKNLYAIFNILFQKIDYFI